MSTIIKIINLFLIANIIYKISIKENSKYINTTYFYLITISFLIILVIKSTNESIILSFIIILLTKVIIDFIIENKIINEDKIILIQNGKLNIKEIIKNKKSMKKLSTKLKEQNINSINDIDFAILEKNGDISIYLNSESIALPIAIIYNGNINYNMLRKINKNDKWLLNKLENKKVNISEILLAILAKNSIYIIKK